MKKSTYKPDLFIIDGNSQKKRKYIPVARASINQKGVVDVDSVKGCELGMAAHPIGGCYNECYAYKLARARGFDFCTSVSRLPRKRSIMDCAKIVYRSCNDWYRIGTSGDPSHDWVNTIDIIKALSICNKTPVIVTKHWVKMDETVISNVIKYGCVVNTSLSALDTDDEICHRIQQHERLCKYGARAVLRVVTAKYGNTEYGRRCKRIQDEIISRGPYIDTPYRLSKSNRLLCGGHVMADRVVGSNGGSGSMVSIWKDAIHLGRCCDCPDKCGTIY